MNRLAQPPLVVRSPHGILPPPGTAVGNQRRDEFESKLLTILGNPIMLWVPRSNETTTSTDRSRYAATLTYNATFAGQYEALGSGRYATFDGSTDEADTPDADRHSLGDSTFDYPMSVVALVNPDTVNAVRTIYAKWDETTATPLREYWFYIDASGYPSCQFYDESADTYIGRQDQTALTASTWVLLSFCYGGGRALADIDIFKDAAVVDDANVSSGTYVAMENSATLPTLGFHIGASATEEFWDGGIAFVAATAKKLSTDENWAVKVLVNAYYGLSL